MIKKREINIILNDKPKKGYFFIDDNRECALSFYLDNIKVASAFEDDYFSCLSKIRNEVPNIVFLCNGSKLNVYPSRMSRQMSKGIMAYEYTLGSQAKTENLVNIFDYSDENISSVEEQDAYYRKWLNSLN